jgi:ketosteroid isomerase-like protein
MRAATSLVIFALLLVAPASASEETDIFARLQRMVDAWNKNDSATVRSMATESVEIIDVFPPYHWAGPNALQAWNDGFAADAKANSVTEPSVELLQPTHVDLGGGDAAYVVVPAIYHWKKSGEKMQEKGIITAALHKVDQKWQVAAFSWTRQ